MSFWFSPLERRIAELAIQPVLQSHPATDATAVVAPQQPDSDPVPLAPPHHPPPSPPEFFRHAPYSTGSSVIKVSPSEKIFRDIIVAYVRYYQRIFSDGTLLESHTGESAAAAAAADGPCAMTPPRIISVSMSVVRLQTYLKQTFPEAYHMIVQQKHGGKFHLFLSAIPGFRLFQYSAAVFHSHPELECYFSVDELRCAYDDPLLLEQRAPESSSCSRSHLARLSSFNNTVASDMMAAKLIRQCVETDLVAFCGRCHDVVKSSTCWPLYAMMRKDLWKQRSSDSRPHFEAQTASRHNLDNVVTSRRDTALVELVWQLQNRFAKRISAPMIRYVVGILLELLYIEDDEIAKWFLPPVMPLHCHRPLSGSKHAAAARPRVPIVCALSMMQQRRFVTFALLRFIIGADRSSKVLDWRASYDKIHYFLDFDANGDLLKFTALAKGAQQTTTFSSIVSSSTSCTVDRSSEAVPPAPHDGPTPAAASDAEKSPHSNNISGSSSGSHTDLSFGSDDRQVTVEERSAHEGHLPLPIARHTVTTTTTTTLTKERVVRPFVVQSTRSKQPSSGPTPPHSSSSYHHHVGGDEWSVLSHGQTMSNGLEPPTFSAAGSSSRLGLALSGGGGAGASWVG